MAATGVILGGEHLGRGLVRGRRSGPEWVCLLIFGGAGLAIALIFGGQIAGTISGLAMAAVGLLLFTPLTFAGMQRSIGVAGWDLVVYQWRKRTRRTRFTPARLIPAEEAPAKRALFASPPVRFELPDALGQIMPVNIDFPNGSQVALLRHVSEAQSPLYTVTFEMRGGIGGVDEEDQDWRSHMGWARFAGAMARRGSLVRSLQQTARVVPFDTTDHETWLQEAVPAHLANSGAQRVLRESYLQLLQTTPQRAEQHRTWLTIGMPQSAQWRRRAGLLGDGFDGDRALAWDQVRGVMSRARACGLALRPLSEPQLAGVVRSLFDPAEPVDRTRPHGLVDAFVPMDDSHPEHVVVSGGSGQWFTRTIQVQTQSLSGVPVRPDFLRPLLTSVEPSVVRTLSSSVVLTPAPQARASALKHASRDSASARKARSVSDGTEEVQAAGSQLRLEDLRPGSGVHGASWAFALTYSAASLDELQAADEAIAAAADDAMITDLRHVDRHHLAAHVATLPLGRGVREEFRWFK